MSIESPWIDFDKSDINNVPKIEKTQDETNKWVILVLWKWENKSNPKKTQKYSTKWSPLD